MYTEQIFLMVDGLIYPLVQNVYRTYRFNGDGLIYPLVQNVYRTYLFNVDGLIYPTCAEYIQNRSSLMLMA